MRNSEFLNDFNSSDDQQDERRSAGRPSFDFDSPAPQEEEEEDFVPRGGWDDSGALGASLSSSPAGAIGGGSTGGATPAGMDFSQFDEPPPDDGSFDELNDPNNRDLLQLNELVPPDKRTAGEPILNVFLKALTFSGGSDLHLNYNVPPIIRVHGRLKPMAMKPITSAAMSKMIFQILDEEQRRMCDERREVDACYEIPGVGRYRMNIYQQLYGLSAVFRSIPVRIKSIQEVGLEESIAKLALYSQGFIVVTGATGSGKSTTLAAIIDYVNSSANRHIVTIEDPLEFVHVNKKSIVTHREVGNHSKSFSDALRAALRQDPDMILLGELRDLETIEIALTAAETGHMVMGTLHTNNASETVSRIISAFPADRQAQIAMQLSTVLTAVISQELLPTKDNKGRCPIREVLVGTTAVRSLIRDAKIPHIYSAIEMGQKVGMKTMKQSVEEQERAGKISAETARSKIEQLSSKH